MRERVVAENVAATERAFGVVAVGMFILLWAMGKGVPLDRRGIIFVMKTHGLRVTSVSVLRSMVVAFREAARVVSVYEGT